MRYRRTVIAAGPFAHEYDPHWLCCASCCEISEWLRRGIIQHWPAEECFVPAVTRDQMYEVRRQVYAEWNAGGTTPTSEWRVPPCECDISVRGLSA